MSKQQAATRLETIIRMERHAFVDKTRSILLNGIKRQAKLNNAQIIGTIAEKIVTIDLMRDGYEVFTPTCPGASCDMLAIKQGSIYRVEVKFISDRAIRPSALHIILGGKLGKFDILAVVQSDWRVRYIEHDVAKRLLHSSNRDSDLANFLLSEENFFESGTKVATEEKEKDSSNAC